jgi:hypothetical protein
LSAQLRAIAEEDIAVADRALGAAGTVGATGGREPTWRLSDVLPSAASGELDPAGPLSAARLGDAATNALTANDARKRLYDIFRDSSVTGCHRGYCKGEATEKSRRFELLHPAPFRI